MSDEKTPVLRVAVGTDPNNTALPGSNAVDYQFVQLGWQASHNGFESAKQGRPVFDKVLMLTHIYPGSTDTLDVEVKRFPSAGGDPLIADPGRATRFADIIEKFEAKAKDMEGGTPLAVLNFDPAQIKNLEASGASTVEMLAAVPDSNIGKLGMGARNLRTRAVAYLESLNGGEAMAKLQSQLDGAAAEVDELRNQVRELIQERKPVPMGMQTPGGMGGDGEGDRMPQSLTGTTDDAKREMAAKGASSTTSDGEKENFRRDDPTKVEHKRDLGPVPAPTQASSSREEKARHKPASSGA